VAVKGIEIILRKKQKESMYHNKNWVIGIILLLSDVALLYGIFILSVLLRNLLMPLDLLAPLISQPVLWSAAMPMVQLGILLGIVTFFFQGLYPGYGFTAVKELEQMSKSVTLVFFFLAGISYLNKPFQDFSRSVLLIAWFLALGILPVVRFGFRNFLSRFSWYGIPVVVFGDGEWVSQVTNSLRRVRRLGWQPQETQSVQKIDKTPENKATMAILAVSMDSNTEHYARVLSQCFRKVILISPGNNFGTLWVEPRDLDGNLGLEYSYHLLAGEAVWLKRLIDFLGSFLLLAILSPLLLVLAVMIMIDSRGPIFFRQERIGQYHKRFIVFKFRSMVVNAEQKLEQILQEDSSARDEYEKFHKLKNDPRISRVGKWLRRFSLDEFPQLLNVLKGEMSLVGPRAYMPSELDEIGVRAPVILRAKPGMTGWWQVMGRHQTTFQQRLLMDEYYISNWSLWMDFYILLKTAWVVQSGKGA